MTRQLTEKQQKLLNVLFDEAGGNVTIAKKIAGYADTSSTADIVKGLKAAMSMTGALLEPTELGIKEKMTAAKEILDRVGLVKTEKMQVEATGGVMLMPPKAPTEDDD